MSEPAHQLPSAPPQASQAQTRASVIDAYSKGASQFHACEYHQAIKTYRQLLRQQQDLLSKTLLWFNIGVLRDHLGEHALAAGAYEKAIKLDKSFSIGWFSLGTTTSLLGDYRRALRVFKICEKTLKGDSIDYREQGLPWTLEKTRVIFNIRQTQFLKLHKQHKAPLDTPWSLNRLPAGIIFEHSIDAIPGGGEDTKPSLGLHEAGRVKLVEPQARAEVKPQSVAHGKLGRSATARVTNLRKKIPFSTARSKLGRHATTAGVVADAPKPFAASQNWEEQSFDDRHQTVKRPDSQRETDVQLSAEGTRRGSVTLPRAAHHLRMDSLGIFAQGEPELRRLQADATEASTRALPRSRSFSHGRRVDRRSEAP